MHKFLFMIKGTNNITKQQLGISKGVTVCAGNCPPWALLKNILCPNAPMLGSNVLRTVFFANLICLEKFMVIYIFFLINKKRSGFPLLFWCHSSYKLTKVAQLAFLWANSKKLENISLSEAMEHHNVWHALWFSSILRYFLCPRFRFKWVRLF